LREEATEIGNTNIRGFMGADALRGIRIIHRERKTRRRVFFKTGSGCSKVLRDVLEKVKVSKIPDGWVIVIEAAIM
jgi:hypothetical protein